MIGTVFEEFFFADAINCVVKGGASAIVQFVDAHRERLHIVGEILHQLGLAVETDDERAVESGADRVLQEAGGSSLFKIEAAVDRAAYVNEQTEIKRQIGFTAKVEDGLGRFVVIENREVGLRQIANKFAVFVGRDKQEVHFIDALVQRNDAGLFIVRTGGHGGNIGNFGREGRVSVCIRRLSLGAGETGGDGQEQRHQPKDEMRVLHALSVQFFHSCPIKTRLSALKRTFPTEYMHVTCRTWRPAGCYSLTLGVRGAEAKLQKECTFGHTGTTRRKTAQQTPEILPLAAGAP